MFGDLSINSFNWPLSYMGDVADIKIGPFGSLLHQEDYVEGGRYLINPSQIVGNKIVPDSKVAISEEKYSELSSYSLEINDIVLGRRGEMGRAGIVITNGMICGTGSIRIRPNDPVDAFFIWQELTSDAYRQILERESVGTTMMNLNVKIVSKLQIPQLPVELKMQYTSIVEQADKSKFDGFKSQFIEMFGDISKARYNFQTKKLGDICRVINGRAYSANELLSEGKYRVLRVGNFFSNDSWYYSDMELEPDKYCDAGDLLFAWSCTLGPRIWEEEKAIFHYHIWKITDYEQVLETSFFFEQLKHIAKKMKSETHGSTMVHLTKSQFESEPIIVPPVQSQKDFVDILAQADKSKSVCRLSIKQLAS